MSAAPPTLRQVLDSQRRAEVFQYLVLREAMFALGGISESVVEQDGAWAPAILRNRIEFLRMLFSGAGGAQTGMPRLVLTAPQELLEEVARDPELRWATRRRLLEGAARRGMTEAILPLGTQERLADGLAAAMLLRGRLAACHPA